MSGTNGFAAEREQAQAELERVQNGFAELLQRRADVAVLVEQRRQEQRDAALCLERDGGGKDGKALTKAVAALNEVGARADALAELCGSKQAEVDEAQANLTVAIRAEAEARHQAEVGAAVNEVETIGNEVKAAFEALALSQGSYLVAYQKLVNLDRGVAVEAARSVSPEALVGGLLAAGFQPVTWGGDTYGRALAVPAVERVAPVNETNDPVTEIPDTNEPGNEDTEIPDTKNNKVSNPVAA